MSGLVVADLASAILAALGPPTDKDGNPVAVTSEMTAYAQAVIDTLTAGKVAHAPGTVTGSAPATGDLTAGAATAGLVSGLLPATWLGDLTSGFPGANAGQLSSEASGSTAYLMGAARVAFASGKITGKSSATPAAAGALLLGAGSGGTIGSLSGSAWAAALGTSLPLASPVYTAIASYVMSNAKCAYAAGKVVGAFIAGAGPTPMTLGAGADGTIA